MNMYGNKLDKSTIEKYLCDDYFLGSGKEVNAYRYNDLVIKIFNEDKTSPFVSLSEDAILKLASLPLKCFNKPIDIIVYGDKMVGYTEKYLEECMTGDSVIYDSLRDIKDDITVLSQNGFVINDLFYNYALVNDKIVFYDMTSYNYVNTNVSFLLDKFFKQNIDVMNTFLVGYLYFDAFRKGSRNEYTKIYNAQEYIRCNLNGEFFSETLTNSHVK